MVSQKQREFPPLCAGSVQRGQENSLYDGEIVSKRAPFSPRGVGEQTIDISGGRVRYRRQPEDSSDYPQAYRGNSEMTIAPERVFVLAEKTWRLGASQGHTLNRQVDGAEDNVRCLRDQLFQLAEQISDKGTMLAEPRSRPIITDTSTQTQNIILRRELALIELKLAAVDKTAKASDNTRLRKDLWDRDAQVVSLEQSFIAYVQEKRRMRARTVWLKTSVLNGSDMLYNTMACLKVCRGWRAIATEGAHVRRRASWSRSTREVASRASIKMVMYFQRQLSSGLISAVMFLWLAFLTEARIQKQMDLAHEEVKLSKQDATEQLNRAMGGSRALLQECIALWVSNMVDMRLQGEFAKARDDAAAQLAKVAADKKRLMERFGESAMAQMRKMLNGHADALLQWAFKSWDGTLSASREAKVVEKERQVARLSAVDSRRQLVEKTWKDSATGLCYTAFHAFVHNREDAGVNKKRKQDAMTKGIRGISSSEYAFKNLIFDSWGGEMVQGRQRRKLEAAREQENLIAMQLRAAKLDAAKFAFSGLDKALSNTVFCSWEGELLLKRKRERMKQKIMMSVGRQVEALVQVILAAWSKLSVEDQELARERGRRRKRVELGKEIIIRLRRRVMMRALWTAWRTRVK